MVARLRPGSRTLVTTGLATVRSISAEARARRVHRLPREQGAVTVGGSEQSTFACIDWEWDDFNYDWYCAQYATVYDSGTCQRDGGKLHRKCQLRISKHQREHRGGTRQ